jgi:hypothetical protein
MESQQPATGGDRDWHDLLQQYELVQMASALAFQALLDAYKPTPDGLIAAPSPEVLMRYRNASALRAAAEQALLSFIDASTPGDAASIAIGERRQTGDRAG